MSWPFRDYDFYGDRYVNVKDPNAEFGEIMWYDRNIDIKNVIPDIFRYLLEKITNIIQESEKFKKDEIRNHGAIEKEYREKEAENNYCFLRRDLDAFNPDA